MNAPYFESENGRLYCGDCLEIMPELEPVDLVLTDPPYGIFKHGGTWGHKKDLLWDKKPAANIEQVIKHGSNSIIWGGNYFNLPPSRCWLIWYKRDSTASTADAELAWTSYDKNTKLIDWTIAATNKERVGHPTQKPLGVIKWCLSLFDGCNSVIDPFLGSGTTAVACEQLNRKWIGIEISEKYCEIAAKRIQHETQQLKLFK